MYFTEQQRKALWFVVVVFALAVGWQYVQHFFFPPPPTDFSAFEKEFYRKRDSLRQRFAETTLDTLSRPLKSTKALSAGEDAPININTASAEELETLPRIGPKIAQRIIRYRTRHGPFRRKEDLMKVKGIGKKTLEKLQDLITVGNNQE